MRERVALPTPGASPISVPVMCTGVAAAAGKRRRGDSVVDVAGSLASFDSGNTLVFCACGRSGGPGSNRGQHFGGSGSD